MEVRRYRFVGIERMAWHTPGKPMFALISLGFTLSLDNFRMSIALGGLKPTLMRSIKTSFIFGLWDGIAPLVGLFVNTALAAASTFGTRYGPQE